MTQYELLSLLIGGLALAISIANSFIVGKAHFSDRPRLRATARYVRTQGHPSADRIIVSARNLGKRPITLQRYALALGRRSDVMLQGVGKTQSGVRLETMEQYEFPIDGSDLLKASEVLNREPVDAWLIDSRGKKVRIPKIRGFLKKLHQAEAAS